MVGWLMATMESSLRRKRKETKSSDAIVGTHLSDNVRRCSKKSREEPRLESEKAGSSEDGKTGALAAHVVIMTAPPFSGSSSCSAGRGLKRKLGCVDLATKLGRRKRLEQEYVLGQEIGQGKFGLVRLCCSRIDGGKEFACKTLPKNGEETVQREVEIMQHLSGHPGVVTLKAVFEDSECFHLVMELCSGGRLLDQMVTKGRYSEQRVAILMKELVSVIKYCHEMGVVHRDIKPENILLTSSGKMKLADFGLAVRVTNGQKLNGVAGSPAYVAPEVLTGHYTEKVDIWSAGVLLHALLVGVLPFQGDTRDSVFEAIKKVNLNFHSVTWEPISELARDLVSQMLNRDVSTRITAEEVLRHPWILFYTEYPQKSISVKQRVACNHVIVPKADLKRIRESGESVISISISSSESSSLKSEELEDYGFVDALAAAIGRVRISEPKRSRICAPPPPIQQECSSNLKSNLCAAF